MLSNTQLTTKKCSQTIELHSKCEYYPLQCLEEGKLFVALNVPCLSELVKK